MAAASLPCSMGSIRAEYAGFISTDCSNNRVYFHNRNNDDPECTYGRGGLVVPKSAYGCSV